MSRAVDLQELRAQAQCMDERLPRTWSIDVGMRVQYHDPIADHQLFQVRCGELGNVYTEEDFHSQKQIVNHYMADEEDSPFRFTFFNSIEY